MIAPMPRALISVSDKTGLITLGGKLIGLGWELVASGGTARALQEAGCAVMSVEALTRHPEILGGRVKTLHPAVHAGILARDSAEDRATLEALGYGLIDMVVCNLYPFEDTIRKPGVTFDDAIEQIDIGGVALLRAAAKNHARVIVLSDPAHYELVLAAIMDNTLTADQRRDLAAQAFRLTHQYDGAIADYLMSLAAPKSQPALPSLGGALSEADRLRYGENPHQMGWYVSSSRTRGKTLGGDVIGGKQLSYNNLLDIDAAWRAVELFGAQPTVVIVKHLSPCGIATADNAVSAFHNALACDPVSAFGGVIAVNQPVDDTFVAALGDLFIEVIAAPSFSETALITLADKRKNCRLLRIDRLPDAEQIEFRSVRGGLVAQDIDRGDPVDAQWQVVSRRQPIDAEVVALRFAWIAAQAVKSNAIVLAHGLATVGIGGGLPSRVDAARLAVEKAGDRSPGSVLASDAFFPFPDALEVGIRAGITAAISPGGSVRDEQVIAAADAAGIALVFTGVRHFRH
jgi:phosphoribosylaminoimidazolecarboxamide formyltransferase/IMP cyclohydrolase